MPCTDIHFINSKLVKSGSKVTRAQFYALRVLRRRFQRNEMDAGHLARLGISDLREARAILEAHQQWRQFLNAVEVIARRPTAALGMFAIVLVNQRMACGTVVFRAPTHTMTLRTRLPVRARSEEDGSTAEIDEDDDEDDEDDEGEDDEEDDDEDDKEIDDTGFNRSFVHPFSTRPAQRNRERPGTEE
jgi:hypothetical protein